MTGEVEIDGWTIFPKGTALMWAAARGHTGVARLLVEREGGMSTSDGWTALMDAVCNNQIECVKLLAERERDINRNKLLDIAKGKGNREIIAIL